MSEFLDVVSPKAEEQLNKVNQQILEIIKNVNIANDNMIGVKTPSGTDSAIKQLNNELIKQQKLQAQMQIQLEKYAQAQQQTIIKNNQREASEIRLNRAKEVSIKQLEREQAKLQVANSLYSQTQQKVNELTRVYNDLALKKELGQKLTDKEIINLHKLTNEINTYQTALKKVDSDIQKYGRNVGNYASGWNGLSNSINQLTREAPAFANSVQTGFMALSNNLPILFDEITRVKNANKELIAQGQPYKSTFLQIAGAIFSWQTLLATGVTLLTLYGAKIWDSVSGAKAKKEALEKEKKALEEKIQAEQQQNEEIGRSIAQEQNRARVLFEIAKNEEVSAKKRKEALDELRSRYGKYLEDLSNEQILAGQTAEAEERLNKALVGRGYALATQNLLEANLTKQMEAQVEFEKATLKSAKAIQAQVNAQTGAIINSDKYMKALRENSKVSVEANKILNDKLKPLKAEEEALLSLFRVNAKYLDSVNETVEKKKKEKKAIDDVANAVTNSENAFKANISALEKQLANTDRFSEAYNIINGLLQFQIQLYNQLFGTIKKGQEEVVEGIQLTEEEVYYEYFAWLKLKQATDDYIKTLSSDAFNKAFDNIGLKSAKMFLDFDKNGQSTFDKLLEGADSMKERFALTFQSVGDVAQEVFGRMIEMSNQRFQNEYDNLAKQKEISLLFAGESASAREEIERQYDVRQREIKRRQAQAEKRQALFNIAIDTAQGVVSALASTPPNVPLSIAIGVIGAVQAGIVASQQIPQFWKGTENAPEGWAYTQERGAEIITDKNNRIKYLGDNKGAQLTYLNKGDKVKTASMTKELLSFDQSLNNILLSNNIDGAPRIEVNNSAMSDAQVDRIVRTIEGKTEYTNIVDQNGFTTLIKRGNTIYENKNRKVNFKGTQVG